MRLVLIRYLAVAALVRLADEGVRVAFVLLALAATGEIWVGGLLVGAFMVPHVLAAPAVGALADRVRRRRPLYVIFLTCFAAAIAACGLLTGRAPLPVVLLIAVIGGSVGPLATGGLSSLLRALVPADRRQRAFSLDVMTYSTAGIVGPAAAGLVAAGVGPRAATLALAVSAFAAAVLVGTLPIPTRTTADRAPAGILSRFGFGVIGAIWRERHLRAVTVATGLGAVSFGALPVAAALLAVRFQAEWAAGALLSASAAGGLLGALLYARFPLGGGRPHRVVILCLLASAVPLALVPVASDVGVTLALFAVAGFFVGPQSAALFATRDRHSPPAMHTQVFTLGAGLKISFAAIGAAVAGAVAGFGPAPVLLGVAACMGAAAGLGGALVRPVAGPTAPPVRRVSSGA